MLTSGALSSLQEVLASYIAGDRSRHGSYFTPRVPKMAVYGSLISAPLGHILVTALQKAFAGRTSTRAKVLQILVSNLIVSPIQNTVYLACMAVIAGARTAHQIRATVKAGFLPVMKVAWCTSPIALIIAQKFLPPHAWVPFFNLVAFVVGTYINTSTKKKRIQAIKKKKVRFLPVCVVVKIADGWDKAVLRQEGREGLLRSEGLIARSQQSWIFCVISSAN